MALAITFVSCDKDDDDSTPEIKAYGLQIKGDATGDKSILLHENSIVEPGSNYETKAVRSGMYQNYVYLKAGSLSLKNVTVGGDMSFGFSDIKDVTQTNETVDPVVFKRGTITEGGSGTLNVTEGFYFIVADITSKNFWLVPVVNFELSVSKQKATIKVGATLEKVEFELTGAKITGKTKIRVNTAWKIIAEDVLCKIPDFTEDHVRIVTSYGGTLAKLDPKGGDIEFPDGKGVYDITVVWTPGKSHESIVTTATKTGDLQLEYPEKMYMIGQGIGGWDWAANTVEMLPVHSNTHLFWRIVWVNNDADDGNNDSNAAGFKFNSKKEWGGDFGVSGAAVEGVYSTGGENVKVETSGYYIVVVNLKTEKIEVVEPSIYGIGDAFNGWDAAKTENKFTVDNTNKVIVFNSVPKAGDLRIHVAATQLLNADSSGATEWWNNEFSIISGKIEYRGVGGDLAAVPVTAGQKVSLNFVEGTGVIE